MKTAKKLAQFKFTMVILFLISLSLLLSSCSNITNNSANSSPTDSSPKVPTLNNSAAVSSLPASSECNGPVNVVCGTDNKNYPNDCFARLENITIAHTGPCFVSASNSSAAMTKVSGCSNDFAPVCGADGNSYQNECQAKAKGTTVAANGFCFTTEKMDSSCPDGYGPVCGKDGKTYLDSCQMTSAGTTLDFVGKCTEDRDDAVGPNRCGNVFNFVCGTNGITFANECLSRTFNVSVAHKGVCS